MNTTNQTEKPGDSLVTPSHKPGRSLVFTTNSLRADGSGRFRFVVRSADGEHVWSTRYCYQTRDDAENAALRYIHDAAIP